MGRQGARPVLWPAPTRRWLVVWAVLVLLGSLFMRATPPLVEAAEPPWEPLADGPSIPRTDGATIVGNHIRGYTPYVVGMRVTDRQLFTISDISGPRLAPAVDGAIVVWQAHSEPIYCAKICPPGQTDIVGRDLSTGETFIIGASPQDDRLPAVRGTWVAWWWQEGRRARLLARDLRAMGEPATLAETDGEPSAPVWNGDRLLWSESWTAGTGPARWRLRASALAPAAPAMLAEGSGPGLLLDSAGDLVILTTGRLLLVIDLRTGERWALAEDVRLGQPYTNRNTTTGVTTDGRYVFWSERLSLRAFDRLTGCTFPVARGEMPHTRGGLLVWMGITDTTPPRSGGLFAVSVAAVVEQAPAADRCGPLPAQRFFPETGQILRHFLPFWDRNGGLPVFGYPVTGELSERVADNQPRHVQYVERQRFEEQPANAGTPYEVELGRLGAEEAARRDDLSGLWAFAPVAPEDGHPAGCIYLVEARHRLCGEFRPYWEGHGLEFGDAGVTFRESLALFGYPISEEFIDPATGLITQFFERAVFEYHPQQPTTHRVLLVRLGVAAACRNNWAVAGAC